MTTARHPPRDCPVCGARLLVTRLGCEACGTELSGGFASCDFCALGAEDRELLRLFLISRGNLKELERSLQVSYPTVRARFDALLGRLGLELRPPAGGVRLELLRRVARGELGVDAALGQLRAEGEEA